MLGNPDDIDVRKLLVNTFIREILYYPDKIIITYNSNEHSDTVKFTDKHFDEIEKQVDKACSSYKKKFKQTPLCGTKHGAAEIIGCFFFVNAYGAETYCYKR